MKTRGKVATVCAVLALPYIWMAMEANDRRLDEPNRLAREAHAAMMANAKAIEPERCLWYLSLDNERANALEGQDRHNRVECRRRLMRSYELAKTWHELQPQMR